MKKKRERYERHNVCRVSNTGKNCVAQPEAHMRKSLAAFVLFSGAHESRRFLDETLNRTGSSDEEGSTRDIVSTCWSIAPSST